MDLLQELGMVALGSRLRRLGETFAGDAAELYRLYEVGIQPKWFPVFYLLSREGESSITAMARSIGCSHPVVSQIVKEMAKAGLAATSGSRKDARVNMVRLTDKGQALVPRMEIQMRDVLLAVKELFAEMQYEVWKGLEELEFLLGEKRFYDRVAEKRKERESGRVEIVDYSPQYRENFKILNLAWIERDFELEPSDVEALDYPEETILQPGGCIILARLEDGIVGTCALKKLDAHTFELVKMTVAESMRGKNIGRLLGKAILEKARELGARKVLVESNTCLKPAINLYRSLGFRRTTGTPSPYARCNIQMEREIP